MRRLVSILALSIGLAGAYVSYSQTGPGGIGNAVGGAAQPRNVLWLDANSLSSLADGANILSWPDRSGNGNNALAVAGSSPLFEKSTLINGSPYAIFNNANRLVINPFNDMPEAGYTFIIVYRTTDSNEGLFSYATATEANSYLLYNSNSLDNYIIGTTANSSVDANGNSTIPKIVLNSWENNNGTSVVQLNGAETGASFGSVTGIQVGESIEGGGSFAIGGIQTGVNTGYTTGTSLAGDVVEIIGFASKLNDAQVRIINNYLAAKYAITLAAAQDNFAGTSPYINQLAGIGQRNNQAHTEANSAGMILSTYNTSFANDEYVMTANDNTANTVVTTNLPAGVQQRWSRLWYLDKTGTVDAAITFDLGEGIGGYTPQNKDNHVLLYRAGTTGNFTALNIVSADKSISGDRITFRVANASLADGYYTFGTTNSTASPVNGIDIRTWYSYQSGNWSDPNVWTLDPAVIPLFVNPSNEIPNIKDRVIITNGRTVIANTSGITVAGAEIYGTLDVATSGNHNFTTVGGDGRIKIAGYNPGTGAVDNFPGGDAAAFADAITGGTVEVYGTGLKLNQARTFNNVVINTNAAVAAIVKANYVVNGSLLISRGVFQIDDNTAGANLSITVSGNVNVEPTGQVTVGVVNRRHEFNFYGDFINNGGSVSFTNLATPSYTADPAGATLGIVDANFLNDTGNQQVICNGVTKFYRIEVDKGSDDTYKVHLSASSAANFGLYGRANFSNDPSPADQLTTNDNAVGLIYGTLEVGSNIAISTLSNANYYAIYKGAQLVISGTGASVVKPSGLSILVYNKINISNGALTATGGTGIELRGTGTLEVEGGVVNCKQLRSLNTSANGGYIQSGGTVTIDGSAAGAAPDNTFAILSLTNAANVFRLEAGTLTVRGAQTASPGLVYINSDPSSVSITGGTTTLEINTSPTNDIYRIVSKAPFWNLTLRRSTTTTPVRSFRLEGFTSGGVALASQPLEVLGNLTIESPVTLNALGVTVEVQSDFTLQSGSTYTTGTNLTLLSGSANGTLDLGSTNRTFNNLTIQKSVAANGVTLANATTLDISGELRVESGFLDYDATIINARAGVYNAGTIGSATGTGKLALNRTTGAQTLSSVDGLFYNLEINNASDITLAAGNARVAKTLTLTDGVFNINIYRLTLEGASAAIAGSGFDEDKMIMTSGEYSDGGLEMYYNATEQFTFPLGTNANSSIRYTPAIAHATAAVGTGRFGYITINPVDETLSTTNATGDVLSYYWRVRYRDFVTLPTVNYQFTYKTSDLVGTETNYLPGKVLDISPFTRSTDGGTDAVIEASNTIYFNGSTAGITFPGAGFALEQANYTAGVSTRFTGTVKVFYSRTRDDENEPLWNDRVTWTRSDLPGFNSAYPHSSSNPAVPNGGSGGNEYPGAGDIAVIGWTPWNDPITGQQGYPHNVWVDNITLSCAQIVFTQMKDQLGNPTARKTIWHTVFIFRPTLTLNTQQALGAISSVKGEGIVRVRGATTGDQDSYDPNFTAVDFGEFAAEDSAYFQYEQFGDVTIQRVPDRLPNLMLTSDGYGSNDQSITLNKTITTRGNLEILGNANLVLNTGTAGNVTIGGNLMLMRSLQNGAGGAELRFGNTGTARTITVMKDIFIGSTAQSIDDGQIRINDANGTPITHTLNLYGSYLQNTTDDYGLKCGTTQTNDYIHLNLVGTQNATFASISGDPLQIVRMTVNKGTSTATTALFNCDFNLYGTTNGTTKALTLTNGLLVLNNEDININLTTGGSSFAIPSTSGLEVRQGRANATGASGIFLDGLLRISGGLMNMAGGDNFIEYSASTKATLNITSGSLIVGSQIRRTLSSTDGVLKYIQTGGSVTVGNDAATQTSRGMFEVVNAQSAFTFSGSTSTLTIVRGVNSTTTPSLLLEPQTYTAYAVTAVSAGLPTITFGDANASTGANALNIGIKSAIPLPNITVSHVASNPVVKLYSLPLTIRGKFTIDQGATFNANSLNLTLNNNFENNGSYISGNNTTIFSFSLARTLSGTGTFDIYQVEKNGAQALTQNVSSLTIKDQFKITAGNWATGTNALVALGDVVVEGSMSSSATGLGLVFKGATTQTLSRINPGVSVLGTVTINNPNSVIIPDGQDYDFTINQQLRLENGVFNIGGNLINMTATAVIVPVNPYTKNNMVRTNTSISDAGIRKNFAANYAQDFIFPVGQSEYTPVRFNFGSAGNTFGTSAGSIRVTLANEVHPSIVEDTETGCQLGDQANSLNYYFTIDGQTIASSFKASAIVNYAQGSVQISNACSLTEADYIAARILYDNNPTQSINKYSTLEVDENANTITFNFTGVTDEGISGDYFAAVDPAIPNSVPVYHTTRNGLVTEGATAGVYDRTVPGGGAPDGAVVIIEPGHTLNFNVNGVSLYKTEIKAGAVLNVSQTNTHRLGIVSGEGTLRITSNISSAVVPAGFYGDFFGCSGGILEFTGTGSYDVLGGIPNVRNLYFTGSGQRLMANNDIFVCENLYVDGPEFYNNNGRGITIENDLVIDAGKFNKGDGTRLLTVNGDVQMKGGEFSNVSIGDRIVRGNVNVDAGTFYVGAGGTITVGGDINYTGGVFNGGSGTVMLALEGTTRQNMNGNFTGTGQFLNVRVNNPAGVNVNNDTDISAELQLTDGVITPDAAVKLRMLASGFVTPAIGRSNSYIDGRLYKTMPINTSFTFPVGRVGVQSRWRYASVNNVSTGNKDWYVEYYIGNPTGLPGLNSVVNDPDVKRVSISEYWRISDGFVAATGTTAAIGLSWGLESDVSPLPVDQEKLVVVVWNNAGPFWENKGGSFPTAHTQASGYVQSAAVTSFSEKIATLASTDPVNPLPIEVLSFTGNTLNNENYIFWETATESNNDYFVLEHSVDGKDFTPIAEIDGGGNLPIGASYKYIDRYPVLGRNYYRLKQVDFDGKSTYVDKLVMLTNTEEVQKLDFYISPNPTTYNKVNFHLSHAASGPVSVKLISLTGLTVYESVVDDAAEDWVHLDGAPTLSQGVYVLEIRQGYQKVAKRVMIK